MIQPSLEERACRDEILERILEHIRDDIKIRLPDFDRTIEQGHSEFALHALAENPFSGSVGPYRYQFEGEDDLLHLIVTRSDGARISAEDARPVARFLLPNVSPAVIWLKPGEFSQHFYLGHDELL